MSNSETDELLKEILKWERLRGLEYLRRMVKEENLFTDEKHIVVYHYTDGIKSSREIGRSANVSHMTVQNLWKQWVAAGIAEPVERYKGGQCKRIFELGDLGIELPKKARE